MNELEQTNPINQMGLVPQTMAQAMELATVLSTSSVVPKDYQGKPADIVAAILLGADVGLAPMQALQSVAVINGRPSLWGDALAAVVRGKPDFEYMTEEWDDSTKTATCKIKRKGEPEHVVKFGFEQAKKAGLAGKQGPWTNYPERMCQMRARSWAMRDKFAHHLKGISIAEEAQDIPAEREINPAPVVPESRTAQTAALLAATPAPTAGPTLAEITAEIAAADTEEKLQAVGEKCALLPEQDKDAAKNLYKKRGSELRKKQAQ